MANALFGGNTFNPFMNSMSPTYRPASAPIGQSVQNYAPVAPMYQQPIMQNVQSMVPQSNIIWIDDISQINNFPTGRGWQQWFGLKTEQTMYVRETDMNGVMQPLRKVSYQLVEETTSNPSVSEQAQPVQQTAPVEPAKETVGREEFNKLSDSVNMMLEKLSDLLK